ncbi:MAG: DUF4388 domain-containing protein [Myxococcaceae bacterium]|nr:DUF4388 domain-containing protein [Myxococcaceae bacterium]
MALKGTLKDFGIADILQLIGQQQKTGKLHLKSKEETVDISFKDGNIVLAESLSRAKKDLIGSMLVQAELITDTQLDLALDTQKRTLQRLGDVLVSMGTLTADKFKHMVQLQTTETLYRLFTWKSGNYQFEQGEVEIDPLIQPLRAESVLMEGFRMVDEWPVVKKRITSFDMTFEKGKPLPLPQVPTDAFDAALDQAVSESKRDSSSKADNSAISENERTVYELAKAGRPVRKLVDLSCLGEFETCKSLCTLVNLEYLKPVIPAGKWVGIGESPWVERLTGFLGRAVAILLVLASVVFVGTRVDVTEMRLGRTSATTYTDPAYQRVISRQQVTRISKALDVYRLERGELPEKLDSLVESGLLARDDLRYPWQDRYYYRRTTSEAFVLLPPLR